MSDLEKARQDLVEFVKSSGLSQDEANLAVNNCIKSMFTHAVGGYVGGAAIVHFMAVSGGLALPIVVAGAGAGAAYALKNSQQCAEIRSAVRYWNAKEGF